MFVLFPTTNTQAHYVQDAAYRNKTDVTNALIAYCGGGSRLCALPWLSMPGSAYYDSTITIRHDQTVVDVVVRGAGYRKHGSNATMVSAAGLAGGGIDGSANARVGDFQGTVFYRGHFPSDGISTQGSEVRAKLYVPNDGPGSKTYTIWLHTCLNWQTSTEPWWHGTSGIGSENCEWHIYRTTVTRQSPQYELTPKIDIPIKTIENTTTKIDSISSRVEHKGVDKSKNASYATFRFVLHKTTTLNTSATATVSGGDWVNALARTIGNGQGSSVSHIKNLTGTATNSIAANSTVKLLSNATDTLDDIGGLSSSMSICYVTAVNNYNGSGSNNAFRYAIKCVSVSKKPKVQVWGGDVKTGKEVLTSVEKQSERKTVERQMSTEQLRAAGLWPTGYDKNGNVLSANGNEQDGHWSLICAKNNENKTHFQRAYSVSGQVANLPNCANNIMTMTTRYQARTIVEKNGRIGQYACSPYDKTILGDMEWCMGSVGHWVRTPKQSRWIGLNSYGMHTSFNSNKDPSIGSQERCNHGDTTHLGKLKGIYRCGNTYVFRLSGVNFNEIADSLKSIKLGFAGAADNLIQVRINGQEAQMSSYRAGSSGIVIDNYTEPGWFDDSVFYASLEGAAVDAVKPTNNTIDIYVVSDHSHMGLLIENISVSYVVDADESSTYGSWAEYSVTTQANASTASGAGLSSGFEGKKNITVKEYNKLTFANVRTPYGNFGSNIVLGNFSVPNVTPKHTGTLAGDVAVANLASGEYKAGNISLNASDLSSGKAIVIKSTGTVTIKGNITYANNRYSSVAQLPQLIISATNIVIDPSVGRVDAWLIAKGYVSTCKSVNITNPWADAAGCGGQLIINGPIMANSLYLRRTYGAQHDGPSKNNPSMHPGTPAEIINLRPDVYLWGRGRSSETGSIRTMTIRELPPRY